MSENETIKQTRVGPVTVESLCQDLRALGVSPGMTLIVHASLSKLGWVAGGAMAVVLALETVLTEAGTLVMPTHSGNWSDPARWQNPPVPKAWWQTIHRHMPAFDPDLTPSWGIGAISECFRSQSGVLRSAHPQHSFAAWGKHAQQIVHNHTLEAAMGDGSPLGHVYELGGHILLMGVGFGNNSSLHLAEHRATWPGKSTEQQGSAMLVDGERRWVAFDMLSYADEDFEQIGAAYEAAGNSLRKGKLGQADSLLMPQPALVEFAMAWIEQNRG